MIFLSKFVAILLAGLVISKTYLDYQKHYENLTAFILWTGAWLCIVYVALRPGVLLQITERIGEPNAGAGTFLGIAFVFLFFVTYRLHTKVHRLEQNIKDIVIKIGIKDLDKE
ncbi:MAG: DUF2304 domain-containing protein [Patescibacteria group bacterium]